MSEGNGGKTLLVFLLGGAIGACLGLLFAPQPGKETREKVRDFIDDMNEKTGELIKHAEKQGAHVLRAGLGKKK